MPDTAQFDALTCPVPRTDYEHVLLGHGSGGRLTADLIRRLFVPGLNNGVLAALEDQATVPLPGCNGQRLAFTTDSFVVRPLFFPGGDIGRLAVYGTVNDLAVGGATPLYLSAAFIPWKKGCHWRTCDASSPRCARRALRPAWLS